MHSWVSFHGFSEVMFEFWEDSECTSWMKAWMTEKLPKGVNNWYCMFKRYNFIHILCLVLPIEMSRKHVSQMFFKGSIEKEARERAPLSQFRFSSDTDFERLMKEMLPSEPYPHSNCGQKG